MMSGVSHVRVWIVAGALACVAMIAAAWFLFVGPQLDNRSTTEQQVADVQLQNSVLQHKVNQLRDDSEHGADLQQQLQSERAGLPTAHEMDAFTRQLTGQAKHAGVVLQSITPGQPTPAVTATGAPAPTTGSAPATGDSTGAGDAADGDAAGSTPAPAATTGPAGNLYSITVTVVADGTMAHQRALLGLIENQGPRRALVTSTSFVPTPVSGQQAAQQAVATPTGTAAPTSAAAPSAPAPAEVSWTMTAQLQIFVAPQSPEQEAALSSQLRGDN